MIFVLLFAIFILIIVFNKESAKKEEINYLKDKLNFIHNNITKLSFVEIAKRIKDIYETNYTNLSYLWRDLHKIVSNEVSKNKDILLKKRHNKIYIDDYGVEHLEEWIKEQDYFIENVILPLFDLDNFILDISNYHVDLISLYNSLLYVEKYLTCKRSKSVPFEEVENDRLQLPRLKFYCDKIGFDIKNLFNFEALFIPVADIDMNKSKRVNLNFDIKMVVDNSLLKHLHNLVPTDEILNYFDEDFNEDEVENKLSIYYNLVVSTALHASIEVFLSIYYIAEEYDYSKNKKHEKEISPLEFEENICLSLKKLGFRAEVTKASGDQGVDVLAEKNDIKFAIQCKLYSYPVGNKAVQEVCAGKDFYDADYGVVVTNNTYTPAAKKLDNKNEIILLNDRELEKLLKYCE